MFRTTYYLFYALLTTSTLLCIMLFAIYSRYRPNILIKTCCGVVITLNMILFCGEALYGSRLQGHDDFCFAQAVLANYCYISIHAHVASLMINNCIVALNSRYDFGFARNWISLTICFVVPLLPTIFIALELHNTSIGKYVEIGVYPLAFYCAIDDPRGAVSSLWFVVFAVPGIIAACYVLLRVFNSRKLMLQKAGSQFNRNDIARLFFSVLIYVVFSIFTFRPLTVNAPRNYSVSDLPAPSDVKSPWEDPAFCYMVSSNIFINYEKRLRCPAVATFIPCLIGIVLFIMYGFSSTAKRFYSDTYHWSASLLRNTKRSRRQSTMPLIPTTHVTLQPTELTASEGELFHRIEYRRMSEPNLVNNGENGRPS